MKLTLFQCKHTADFIGEVTGTLNDFKRAQEIQKIVGIDKKDLEDAGGKENKKTNQYEGISETYTKEIKFHEEHKKLIKRTLKEFFDRVEKEKIPIKDLNVQRALILNGIFNE